MFLLGLLLLVFWVVTLVFLVSLTMKAFITFVSDLLDKDDITMTNLSFDVEITSGFTLTVCIVLTVVAILHSKYFSYQLLG